MGFEVKCAFLCFDNFFNPVAIRWSVDRTVCWCTDDLPKFKYVFESKYLLDFDWFEFNLITFYSIFIFLIEFDVDYLN